MDVEMVETALIDHLVETYLVGDKDGLTPETPLLELNILDSVEILSVVRFIHDRFGKAVPLTRVVPENFSTVRRIRDIILEGEEENR